MGLLNCKVMSEATHTPEPWPTPLLSEYSAYYNAYCCLIIDQNGMIFQKIFGNTSEEAEGNATRIVECVNALSGIENPKLWVEEYKTMESFHKSSSHDIRMLKTENLKLQAELKALKDFNEVIIRERDWQLEVVVPDLESQIEAVRAELKQAKAEAWQEGSNAFACKLFDITQQTIPEPKNPYKGE